MITQEQWLSMARSFHIDTTNYGDVYIEARQQEDNSFKWIVAISRFVLSKSEKSFVFDIIYRNGLDLTYGKHIKDTRFETYQEAYDFYFKYKSFYFKEMLAQ